jgi:hypothetical protein
MELAVMAHRQQETALQVLQRSMELNFAARRTTPHATSDILAQHGPSWAKNVWCKL